jgi:hypothetical protein
VKRFLHLALSAAFAAATAIVVAQALPASASVTLNVQVRDGDPPPPPAYVFDSEPEVIVVPSTRVYYVPEQDFDLYRYGRYWYINRGGWWYRAPGYRGPFQSIEYDRVPVSVLRVPPKYRRHPLGGPPGQVRKMFDREREEARGKSNSNSKPKRWNRDKR